MDKLIVKNLLTITLCSVIVLSGGDKLPERNIGIKVDEEFYKRVKIRIAKEGINLKEYIIELIEKDLEKNE